MSDVPTGGLEETSGTPGLAVPSQTTQVGGTDGTNLRTLSVDATGKLNIAPADINTTGSLTAAAQTIQLAVAGEGSWTAGITGTWVGTIQFEGSTDGGTTWIAILAPLSGVGTLMSSTWFNGSFRGSCGALSHIRVRASAWTSGTASITLRAAPPTAAVFLNAPLPNSTAYTTLKVSEEPRSLFYDPFDGTVIDTTNRWVTPTGTLTPTQGSSALTFPTSTTAAAFGEIHSIPTFNAIIPGFFQHSWAIKTEAAPVTTTHRFWGMGTGPATPTVTAPLTDAIGFEIDTTGKLNAVVYQSGTKIFSVDCSATGTGAANNQQPLDGGWHRYIVQVRTDRIFFYIDQTNTPVATAVFQVPGTQTMPLKMQLVNGTTPATAATFQIQGAVGADTAGHAQQISDGTYSWRKAKVTSAGSLVVTPASGTLGGQAGVSGTVSVPSGAVVTGIAAQSGSTAASVTIPGITGSVTVPGSNQASTQFLMEPPSGTLVGPCSITFSSTAAYTVEWVL